MALEQQYNRPDDHYAHQQDHHKVIIILFLKEWVEKKQNSFLLNKYFIHSFIYYM